MTRTTICSVILLMALFAPAAVAESFRPSPMAPDVGIETLTRAVTEDVMDRQLFGAPYASVVVGNIDVYDRFPYVEAHYFQVVSDPRWNRLLLGETESGLYAYEGSAESGKLSEPRGLATDAAGRLYVADTGNDRVLILQTRSEFDRIDLDLVQVVEGLSRPYDVAVSDAGTPFFFEDDVLYVADTGKNRILRYALTSEGPRLTASVGELGRGTGHFAGPMAVSVGHYGGASTPRVYVADAHSGSIVELVDDGHGLRWVRSLPHDLGLVTSLDTDHWGNVYAAAPNSGAVQKLTPDLVPLASLQGIVERPRGFHIPFLNVHDHAKGEVTRAGHGGGIVIEQWTNHSGLRLMNLGVEVKDVRVDAGETLAAHFTVTDRAHVTAEIVSSATGQVVARQAAGTLDAGLRAVTFTPESYQATLEIGEYELRLRAESSYGDDQGAATSTSFELDRALAMSTPRRVVDRGPHPNPFNPSTTISFSVPEGPARRYILTIFDLRGRQVRQLGQGDASPGEHALVWDGLDDTHRPVGSGVYLYRLHVESDVFSGKLALVK